jgi:hypothetical protein
LIRESLSGEKVEVDPKEINSAEIRFKKSHQINHVKKTCTRGRSRKPQTSDMKQ